MLGEQNLDKTHDMGPGVFKGANPCVMFNTTIATKKYVPVQDRAKLYAYGGMSPRAKRFVVSIRQHVYHDGGTKLDTTPACLVIDEPLKLCASNKSKSCFSESQKLEDIIKEFQSK